MPSMVIVMAFAWVIHCAATPEVEWLSMVSSR